MTHRWAHLTRVSSSLEADIAKQLLEQEGIPVLVKSDVPGVFGATYQGTVPAGVELLVPDDAVEYARELLDEAGE